MSEVLARLRSQFGAEQVLSGADALPFERDWRGQFPGRALAVLRPRSVAELQAMLRHAHAHQLDVVPQGGNTGLVGGSTPDNSGSELLLSLRRLKQVRSIDPLNLTLCAEAGCLLAELQTACADEGLLLPLSMASEGSCTLGGNLATNAGGTQVLRWGNARDLCLGLEVVTADGQLWSDLAGLRKDHRGLNLRDLFIGSEGSLGVISAAVMKLDLQPRSRLAAWVALPSVDAALALLMRARQQLGSALSGFELMGNSVQRLLPGLPLPAAPWAVLLELSSQQPEPQARESLEGPAGQRAGGTGAVAGAVRRDVAPARIDPGRAAAQSQARHQPAAGRHRRLRGRGRGPPSRETSRPPCPMCSGIWATAICTTTWRCPGIVSTRRR